MVLAALVAFVAARVALAVGLEARAALRLALARFAKALQDALST